MKKKYYTVYDRTDTIIAAGTADDCSCTLGITRDSFLSFVSNTRSGRTKGYTVVVEDLNNGNDEYDLDAEKL